MKLKEAIHDNCTECGHYKSTVQEESFGCDGCGRPINDLIEKQRSNQQHSEYLRATVFYRDDYNAGRSRNTEDLEFCSWACVFKKLKNIKDPRFISFPHVSYDLQTKGMRPKDLYSLIKK